MRDDKEGCVGELVGFLLAVIVCFALTRLFC